MVARGRVLTAQRAGHLRVDGAGEDRRELGWVSTTAVHNDDDDELEVSNAIAMTNPTAHQPVGSVCLEVAITQAHKRSRLQHKQGVRQRTPGSRHSLAVADTRPRANLSHRQW